MRSECSENSSLQNYGRTMSPTQLCARSRTRLQDTWCHIAIHIYTSLRFARLASGTKQGWGYVVVVFTVAILISGLHRQPVCFSARLAKRGFKTSDHGRQPGQQVAIQSLDMDGLGVSQQLLQAAWTWQKCGLLQLLLQTTPLNKSRQQQQLTTTSWFSWQPSWSTLETRMLFNKAVARVLIWRAAHPLPASMRTSGPRPLN